MPAKQATPEVTPEEPRKSPPKSAGPKRRRLTLEERIAASEAETERLRQKRAAQAEEAFKAAARALAEAAILSKTAGREDDAARCKAALEALGANAQ